MPRAPDVRRTRAWRKLRDRVVIEEPTCWLKWPGCTTWSTTGDHVIPYAERPDLALVRSNVRGACASCNHKRGNAPADAITPGDTRPPALDIFD